MSQQTMEPGGEIGAPARKTTQYTVLYTRSGTTAKPLEVLAEPDAWRILATVRTTSQSQARREAVKSAGQFLVEAVKAGEAVQTVAIATFEPHSLTVEVPAPIIGY